MLRSILLLSVLTVPQGPDVPGGAAAGSGPGGVHPGSVLLLPQGSHAMVVEKATQSLFLYEGTRNGEPALTGVIPANTGEKVGDKQYEGDLRTPEGIYFFTGVIDGGALPAEYGVRAFVTDYPNTFDRLAGKHGSNIWLHATNEPERVLNGYNTRGCVVVTNEDLNSLTPLIRTGPYTGSTALIIEEELNRLEPAEIEALRGRMRQLLTGWEGAWESMDTERYMAFYSRSFRGMGRDYNSQKAYKGRLNRQYEYISVDIDNVHVFVHDGEVVAAFDQRYESNSYRASSAKRLYFKLEEGGWKIVSETSRLTATPPPGPDRDKEVIVEIVADWRAAWESMDIDRYMAFYSRSFSSRGMDYDQYRAYKQQLVDRYSFISVEISNLRVYPADGGMIATFDQRYESDSYRARSSKRLDLRLEDGVWRIVRETSQER